VRCFWFNGEFLYAIGNRAAFSTTEGEKIGVISEEELPARFLKNAKEIGLQALKALPEDGTLTCIRTDIGCSDSKIHDKDYQQWNEADKVFFLNEIEYGGTTYFPRALKFDCIPLWAEHYAKKAQDIHQRQGHMAFDELLKKGCFSDTANPTDTCSTYASNGYGLPDVSTLDFRKADVSTDDDYDDVRSSGSM
jgi:hypothetical protein